MKVHQKTCLSWFKLINFQINQLKKGLQIKSLTQRRDSRSLVYGLAYSSCNFKLWKLQKSSKQTKKQDKQSATSYKYDIFKVFQKLYGSQESRINIVLIFLVPIKATYMQSYAFIQIVSELTILPFSIKGKFQKYKVGEKRTQDQYIDPSTLMVSQPATVSISKIIFLKILF